MEIEVIVSAMNIANQQEHHKLISSMNTNVNTLVINQITDEQIEAFNIIEGKNKIMSFLEKGLSKSRNKALNNAHGDILVVADDDMEYLDNFEKIITNAYDKYKDADLIIFYVESTNPQRPTNMVKEGVVDFASALKVCSVEITMKRNSVISNNILFNENFGSGAKYNAGEENIFLFECLQKKLKIYSVNEKIGYVHQADSLWFSGFNEQYFKTKGACYVELYKDKYKELINDFAQRKQKLYTPYTEEEAIALMEKGAKEYLKEIISTDRR